MLARALYLLVTGAFAGLAAWMVAEPFSPREFGAAGAAAWERVFALVLGAFVAGALGLVYGSAQGSRRHALVGLFGGLAIGAVGGPLGLQIGAVLSTAVFGNALSVPDGNLALQIPARVLVFAPLGALIGPVFGIVARSPVRLVNGMIGGLLGGALGGAVFDPIGAAVGPFIQGITGRTEVGVFSRAVGSVAIGAGIGLLVGIVEMARRQAWVKVLVARNEGREHLVDAPQTFIGRDERAHVPLFGDAAVAPHHATIVRQGNGYWLADAGTPVGIGLNGQRVSGTVPLASGDLIQVASHQLVFYTKGPQVRRVPTPEPVRAPISPPAAAPPAGASIPTVSVPAASASALALVATTGPLSGQRFPIATPIEVGREAGPIPLGFDAMASRRHARLEPAPGGVLVSDLGSTNGTLVNGNRVASHLMRLGETVQIGSTVFRLDPA